MIVSNSKDSHKDYPDVMQPNLILYDMSFSVSAALRTVRYSTLFFHTTVFDGTDRLLSVVHVL
jgi:hypothetical protein